MIWPAVLDISSTPSLSLSSIFLFGILGFGKTNDRATYSPLLTSIAKRETEFDRWLRSQYLPPSRGSLIQRRNQDPVLEYGSLLWVYYYPVPANETKRVNRVARLSICAMDEGSGYGREWRTWESPRSKTERWFRRLIPGFRGHPRFCRHHHLSLSLVPVLRSGPISHGICWDLLWLAAWFLKLKFRNLSIILIIIMQWILYLKYPKNNI